MTAFNDHGLDAPIGSDDGFKPDNSLQRQIARQWWIHRSTPLHTRRLLVASGCVCAGEKR